MEQEAEEVKREVAYYKKIAEQTGDLFLRETQELSKLISVVKKTETALRENEVKLRNIIEHSNELFYLHDTNYQLTYISPQCIDFFGYTPDVAIALAETAGFENVTVESYKDRPELRYNLVIKAEKPNAEVEAEEPEETPVEVTA